MLNLTSALLTDIALPDFFKLILYLTFFCVLCMFYGMPIHIIRDVALTIRSFYKRITDFVRYRQATRDMNARYPDATAEEVGREDVCIICREEMRPWQQPAASGTGQVGAHEANGATHAALDERLRPKKLPCGHILHFACLRSWLERQQNCPTCRRPVLTGASTRSQEPVPANHHARDQTQENPPQAQAPAIGNFQQPVVAQNVFTFGPLRIAFGARAGAQGAPQQANNNPPTPNPQGQIPGIGHLPRNGNTFGFQRQLPGAQTRTMANFSPTNMQLQLHQIEHQLIREINSLRVQQNQLYLVRALQGELARLRIAHANSETISTGAPSIANPPRLVNSLPHTANSGYILGANPQHQFVGPNHSSLPPGMALPPGWSVLPLQRLTDERNIVSTDALNPGIPSVQSPMQHSDPPTVSAAPAPEVVNHGNPLMTTATSTDADSSKQLVRKRSETPKDVDKPDGLSTSSPNSESSAARQHIASVSSSDGKMEADTRLPISPTAVQQWGSGSPPIPPNDETETKSVENDKITGSVDDFASDSPSTGRSQAVSEDRDVKGKSIATTVEDFTEDLD